MGGEPGLRSAHEMKADFRAKWWGTLTTEKLLGRE